MNDAISCTVQHVCWLHLKSTNCITIICHGFTYEWEAIQSLISCQGNRPGDCYIALPKVSSSPSSTWIPVIANTSPWVCLCTGRAIFEKLSCKNWFLDDCCPTRIICLCAFAAMNYERWTMSNFKHFDFLQSPRTIRFACVCSYELWTTSNINPHLLPRKPIWRLLQCFWR